MTEKISISGFDIDTSGVPQADIQDKCNLFSENHKSSLRKRFGSEYDYLVILYDLVFVEHLQREAIARKLGWKIPNLHHQLYELGWDYSTDYNENKILYQEALAKLKRDVETAKQDSRQLDANQDIRLKNVLEKVKFVRVGSLIGLGFESKEEYARTLYYMKYKMNYDTPKKLIHLFHRSPSSVNRRLSVLGLNNTYEEGMLIKDQDYDKSIRHGLITQAQHQLENFSNGSNNQDYFRSQLSKIIYEHFPSQQYEVIVGFSNTGILGGGLEIDIPLVVYDTNKKVLYRFAIEYGAKHWHSDERDKNKKTLCENKGWHFLEIFEDSVGGVVTIP